MPTDRDAIARKAQQRTEREAQIYADHWAAMKAGEREQCWSLQGRFRNTVSLSGDEREAWGAVVALEGVPCQKPRLHYDDDGHVLACWVWYYDDAHEYGPSQDQWCDVHRALAEARTRWEAMKAKIEEAG